MRRFRFFAVGFFAPEEAAPVAATPAPLSAGAGYRNPPQRCVLVSSVLRQLGL